MDAILPPVVDEDASMRCDKLGYPCSWSETSQQLADATFDLASRAQAAVDEAADPEAAVEAATQLLAEEDSVVELIPDRTLYASVMFRIEGAPPSVIFTELAGPVGEANPESSSLPRARPVSFRPAGGPITPKSALVLDPFAETGQGCGEDVPTGECYVDKKGRSEGATVAAIMAAHPQISVDYVHAGSDIDMRSLASSVGQYDLIHIATHGSSTCSKGFKPFVGDAPSGNRPLVDIAEGFEGRDVDSNECYSAAAIAPLPLPDASTFESQRSVPRLADVELPEGLTFNNSHWITTTDFWTGRLSSDSIAYFSHCTSADGQLAGSDTGGAFVGWSGYARLETAQDAAVSFWRDMVTEGVEFEVAKQHLVEQDLNWTTVVGFKGVNQAALGARGPNLRARDVITTFVGAELAGGATLNSEGFVEDGEDDTLPEVRFLVEGVRAGAENSTEIEVLIDGDPLEQRINVGEEGSPVDSGPGWSDFEVVVEDFDLERDLTREDTRPDEPREHTWETRVFENESRYSAHRADPVVFSGTIRAKGEIAQINQMEQVPNVEVTMNELVLEFPSNGGAVSGDYQGTAESPGLTVQFALSVEGSYDATSGLIEGTVSGSTTGSSPSSLLSFFNQEGGVLRGTVDHDAGTVDIGLEGDGQSIPVSLEYG